MENAKVDITNDVIADAIINNDIDIKNINGLEYLATIPDNSIELILTDPP